MAVVPTYLYIGTFMMPVPSETEGLHIFRTDSETGSLTYVASHIPGLNVGSFAVDTKRNILYVTNEVGSNIEFHRQYGLQTGGGGEIYAFSISPANGDLIKLGHWPSFGTLPAGIALDPNGKFLIVSHFTSRTTTTRIRGDAKLGFSIEPQHDDATTVLFPLDDRGIPGRPSDVYKHISSRSGPACLHSVTSSPDGSFFIVCDMAKDQLSIFRVDEPSSSLQLLSTHNTPAGSGPRYTVFHPILPVLYVNYEYGCYVETFAYQSPGTLQSLGSVSALADGHLKGLDVLLSDLRIHPSGKFIYTLARGHNVVSVFVVNEVDGTLQRVQTTGCKGTSPKGCAIGRDGRYLYLALSASNEVQVWSIDNDGMIEFTGHTVVVKRPSAILAM